MKDLFHFEIKANLVEDLENSLIEAASSDDEFLRFYYDSHYNLKYIDRFLKDHLLNEFTKYVYVRLKAFNDTEIQSILNIALNQFKTYKPGLREKHLRENLKRKVLPFLEHMTAPERVQELFEEYFKTVFKSYEKHFPLFEKAIKQAMKDFKNGHLGSLTKLYSQVFGQSKKKIQTELTVPQLAYLFKTLKEEKIISTRRPTDLYNVIIETFSSKKREDVSVHSFKNHFIAPDHDTIEYWRKTFMKLVERARKDKEK